jgi:uncharacterized protein
MQAGIDHISMFLLGLMGSGHCLGMCGPLVIALPGSYGRWQAHAIYHAGRVITYTLVGAVLGGIGRGMVQLADLTPSDMLIWTKHIQIAISLPVALFLLLLGLNRMGLLEEPRWMAMASPQHLPGYGAVLKRVLKQDRTRWLFIVGMMLGLLPCGLSYGAFARSLAAGGLGQGALFSALFGLGTLPALMILGTSAGALWRRYRPQAEILAGLIMIAMAVSLLVKLGKTVF